MAFIAALHDSNFLDFLLRTRTTNAPPPTQCAIHTYLVHAKRGGVIVAPVVAYFFRQLGYFFEFFFRTIPHPAQGGHTY